MLMYFKEFSCKLSCTKATISPCTLALAAAGVSPQVADEATLGSLLLPGWPAVLLADEEASRAAGSVKHPSWIYFLQELELAGPQKDFAPSVFSDFHTFLDFKANVI